LYSLLFSCHTTASGYVGPWSPTPTTFNNLYFVLLKGVQWVPNEKTQKFQYKGESMRIALKCPHDRS
jgi:catalase (peroxidase I)